jgi:Terpene synthase family 2, C-terminal metal binding
MVESFTAYLNSVVQQAEDRDNNSIRTIDSYLENRRENIGARPSYVPMELDLDLPDHVFYHPVIVQLSIYIAELIILDNVGNSLIRTDDALLTVPFRTSRHTIKNKQQEMTGITFSQ